MEPFSAADKSTQAQRPHSQMGVVASTPVKKSNDVNTQSQRPHSQMDVVVLHQWKRAVMLMTQRR